MLALVKTISTSIVNLVRKVKVSRFGKDDTVTGMEAMPFGEDSNPIAGMDAVYLELSSRKNKVVVGYINKQQLADVGEKRLYSTNEIGEVQFYIWLHSNGTCEFNGKDNHLAQFEAMKAAMDNFNTFMNAELTKIQTGIIAGGGTYTPGTVNIDVSAAKLNNHLCP